jgi:hypothetical protein
MGDGAGGMSRAKHWLVNLDEAIKWFEDYSDLGAYDVAIQDGSSPDPVAYPFMYMGYYFGIYGDFLHLAIEVDTDGTVYSEIISYQDMCEFDEFLEYRSPKIRSTRWQQLDLVREKLEELRPWYHFFGRSRNPVITPDGKIVWDAVEWKVEHDRLWGMPTKGDRFGGFRAVFSNNEVKELQDCAK